MKQDQFTLFDHKKPIQLHANKVAFYLQSEIIEAYSDDGDMYYLFFYKSHFLTAYKATKLRRHSHIERAFKSGIVFDHPHPLIYELLSSNPPFHMTNLKHLMKKIEGLYSKQEQALILTFFDSFISKKQLFEDIKAIFSEYRRNGQFYSSYQILRILMDFTPKHRLVKSISKDLIFTKYANDYDDQSEALFDKDSIFAEKTFYTERQQDRSFQRLIQHLEKESRWMDIVALSINKMAHTPNHDDYMLLLSLLKQHFDDHDRMVILEMLARQIPAFSPLQQDLFKIYINNRSIQKIVMMMNDYHFTLSDIQVQSLVDGLELLDIDLQYLEPNRLIPLIKPVIQYMPEKKEQLLTQYVRNFLHKHELSVIKEWLMAVDKHHESLQIFRKIDRMYELSDDPDQMAVLGELYYEFGLFDKAVECFSWEMELKPSDPKPIQWLAKIYGGMGMANKSDDYRKLCLTIQKRA